MKKRSFRSTFVSVILVITVAISIVNLAVYGINIKKIRQVEVLKMKTAGERIDDMITISLNNIKGLKQICCTDNYARNILLKNNEKNDIGTKFENQNYMDNALKHIASMDTLILRATIVNKYGNIYCTDTSIPEEYVKTIRNMTKEWMLFEGKEDEYYYGGLQGDNANILTFLYPLHTYGNTPIALLAVDINYKTFQSILENAFYENSGECFILTGEQELFHIGEDLYQKEEKGYIFDKSQKMMKENLIVDTFQSKGKNFYISSRQNMLSGWKIIQVIPEERLFEEVDQKIKWNSIFLLGALMLVVSFSIYYTKKIIEPLEEFCKKISHTKGDQLQIINLEHMKLTREIANVIENYNEMANKMNEYLVREIIYDKNQRKIQSKMLRYQINPHFLYNTLNLIASMGELSDFPEIVEITKNLSCIMQYNVKGSRFVMREIQVQKLTKDNFGKYGEFLDLLDESELKKKSIFQEGFFADVVALEFNQGNQPTISVCHVKKQSENIISFLEAHQYACEGLLPLDGDVIIFVGIMDSDFRTESIEAFYVPKGTFVKLNPLIVHGTQYPVDKEDVHIVCMLPGRTFKNDMLSRRLETGEQIRITRGCKK